MSFPENRNVHRPFHLYEGHTYFVTGKCYENKPYFERNECKAVFKKILEEARTRFKIRLFSWVVLHNHYHLMFALSRPWDEAPVSVGAHDNVTDFAPRGTQSVIPPKSVTDFAPRGTQSVIPPKSVTDFVPRGTQSVIPPKSVTDFAPRGTQSVIPLKNGGINDLKYCFVEFIRKLHKDTSRKINQLDFTPGRKIWRQYWDYCIRSKPDFWFHFNYIIKNPLKHGLVSSLNEAYYYPYSSNPIWLERFGHEGLWESFVRYPAREEIQEE
ncbi:MAG: hypothetical protein WC618_05025 [Patescibacteria group bacterium]